MLKKYFAAADLVVLPYRGILGASSSWSQTLAYGKPFILSQDLNPYLQAEDISDSLQKLHLNPADLLFIRNKKIFAKTILEISDQKNKLRKIARLSKQIAEVRSAQNQIQRDLWLYTPQKPWLSLQWKRVYEIKNKLQPAFAST